VDSPNTADPDAAESIVSPDTSAPLLRERKSPIPADRSEPPQRSGFDVRLIWLLLALLGVAALAFQALRGKQRQRPAPQVNPVGSTGPVRAAPASPSPLSSNLPPASGKPATSEPTDQERSATPTPAEPGPTVREPSEESRMLGAAFSGAPVAPPGQRPARSASSPASAPPIARLPQQSWRAAPSAPPSQAELAASPPPSDPKPPARRPVPPSLSPLWQPVAGGGSALPPSWAGKAASNTASPAWLPNPPQGTRPAWLPNAPQGAGPAWRSPAASGTGSGAP